MPNKKEQQPLFISYLREDAKTVDRLCKELAVNNVAVWLDRKDIAPGQRWKRAIRDAIHKGSHFLACFSQAYQSRQVSYQNEELREAVDILRRSSPTRTWFIAIRLSECEIPDFDIGPGETLNAIQRVDLFGPNWKKGLQQILSVIRPETEYARSMAGVVLTARINNFSELPGERARQSIEALWQQVTTDKLVRKHEAVRALAVAKAFVAFPQLETAASHRDLVDFAIRLLNRMQRKGLSVSIGLDQGTFERGDADGRTGAFGPAVDISEMLCELDSGNRVLVSEAFIEFWLRDVGLNELDGEFSPNIGRAPITKLKSAGRKLVFRILKTATSDRVPPLLAQSAVCEQIIINALREVEHIFSEAVRVKTPDLSAGVSLFAPMKLTDGKQYLVRTNFLYSQSHTQIPSPSNTSYALEGHGTGPLGMAFVQDRIHVVKGLPDRASDTVGYDSKLRAAGIDTEFIMDFGRKPRSFIAIPFSIAVGAPPDGVVCVDCNSPLTHVSVQRLSKIAGEISRSLSERLSLAWKLLNS